MLQRTLIRRFLSLKATPTPNPNSYSFRIPDGSVYEPFVPEGTTCEALHRGMSDVHPFANQLFEQYPGEITSIFIAPRYVTLTKFPQTEWETIEWSLSSFIGHYLTFVAECFPPKPEYAMMEDDTRVQPGDSEVVQIIKELLRDQIRPMVQRDGGDVKMLNFNEKTGILSLAMLGACRTCPSSQNTLKGGIERMMQHFLPEVKEVIEVKGHAFEQGYELKFSDEKALREEAGRVDRERRQKLAPASPRGLLNYDSLAEPDGDA